MATRWDPTIEHVFHSSGITSVMNADYPAVYKLIHEELESTSTYLDLAAKMKSIPFRWVSARSSANDELHLIQSVSQCLEGELPQRAREKIGRAIVEKCYNSLPSLSAIPPGKPCMIADRTNGLDDMHSMTLFWSCGFDLNLFDGDRTSARQPSKGFRLDGSLNLVILTCNHGTLDKVEQHARKDYHETKAIIMKACPRPPLFPHMQSSIQNDYHSTTPELVHSSRSPSNISSNEQSDERTNLHSAMDSISDNAVIVLKIREFKDSQLAPDAMTALRHEIKSYIKRQLHIQTVFIVQDNLIVVYPRSMTTDATAILRDFESNGRFFASPSMTQLSESFGISHHIFRHGTKFEEVIRKVC